MSPAESFEDVDTFGREVDLISTLRTHVDYSDGFEDWVVTDEVDGQELVLYDEDSGYEYKLTLVRQEGRRE